MVMDEELERDVTADLILFILKQELPSRPGLMSSMEDGWTHGKEARAMTATRRPVTVLTPALLERMVEEKGLGPRVAASLLHPRQSTSARNILD